MAKFSDAFRTARKSGAATFTWNGKKYTTKLKEEVAKAKTPVPADKPTPADKPAQDDAPNPDRKKDDTPTKDAPKPTGNVLDTPKADRPTPAADKVVDAAVSAVKGAAQAVSDFKNQPSRLEQARAKAEAKLADTAVAKGENEGPAVDEARVASNRAKVRSFLKAKTSD